MEQIALGDRLVGRNAQVLVIAEAGVNHNGHVNLAHELIDAASAAGADAVKFQTFSAEDVATREAPKADYQKTTTDSAESQLDMLKRLELSELAHTELKKHCEERGVVFLSTPYGRASVDLLQRQGVFGFKISSSDTTNLPLLDYIARTGKVMLLSTGMCDLEEVRAAVDTVRSAGLEQFALLHCTSEYPASLVEANLRSIQTLEREFHCPVGFSDHTPGICGAGWGVAAGACIVEKHFTLDRKLPGPDQQASLEPGEMGELVRLIRQVERALGDGVKRPTPGELTNKQIMQKSLVARRAIAAAEKIDADALTCKRPGIGLKPHLWKDVVGRRAARAIAADEVLTKDCVLWE